MLKECFPAGQGRGRAGSLPGPHLAGPVRLSTRLAARRFRVLPGYLDGPELDAARHDLGAVYPTAGEYHAAPDKGRNRIYTGDEFGGIITFPFPTVPLCRLVVHGKLIAL